MKNFLLDLLFPRRCIGCHESDAWLCDRCSSLIQSNRGQCCYLCRKPNQDGQTCLIHPRTNNRLDGLIIAAHYDGNPILKKAIKELKFYRRKEDISAKLGNLLSSTFRTHFRQMNFELVPVPLHALRLRARGFNQAQVLTCELAKLLPNLHLPKTELLSRIRNTLSQVQCPDRQTRLQNPQGAFAVNGKIDPEITYVLIDDLVTTGATLEECCMVLKTAGAKCVWGLVLARN